MAIQEPGATLGTDFSSPGATALPWSQGRTELQDAEIYWLTTVRPDGRPHVTPLIAVWLEEALHFSTGAEERKARNLDHNPHCILTTGTNTISQGLDVVIEGEAERVTDASLLQRLVDGYAGKYEGWNFQVADGGVSQEGHLAVVYRVAPVNAFGFLKGEVFSQTRWRF